MPDKLILFTWEDQPKGGDPAPRYAMVAYSRHQVMDCIVKARKGDVSNLPDPAMREVRDLRANGKKTFKDVIENVGEVYRYEYGMNPKYVHSEYY